MVMDRHGERLAVTLHGKSTINKNKVMLVLFLALIIGDLGACSSWSVHLSVCLSSKT